MTTTTELSMLESEVVSDPVRGFEFINFNKCLDRSFNEYLLYINENELKLTRKDKNKLGVHFIIKELVRVCRETNSKKWFYYKTNGKSIEHTLVKRIFNALPTNITTNGQLNSTGAIIVSVSILRKGPTKFWRQV